MPVASLLRPADDSLGREKGEPQAAKLARRKHGPRAGSERQHRVPDGAAPTTAAPDRPVLDRSGNVRPCHGREDPGPLLRGHRAPVGVDGEARQQRGAHGRPSSEARLRPHPEVPIGMRIRGDRGRWDRSRESLQPPPGAGRLPRLRRHCRHGSGRESRPGTATTTPRCRTSA